MKLLAQFFSLSWISALTKAVLMDHRCLSDSFIFFSVSPQPTNDAGLNEMCPGCSVRLVNTNACWWKQCPLSGDRDKVALFGGCVRWRQVMAAREPLKRIWISCAREGSSSLKNLISMSGSLTGNRSSCQMDFIFSTPSKWPLQLSN